MMKEEAFVQNIAQIANAIPHRNVLWGHKDSKSPQCCFHCPLTFQGKLYLSLYQKKPLLRHCFVKFQIWFPRNSGGVIGWFFVFGVNVFDQLCWTLLTAFTFYFAPDIWYIYRPLFWVLTKLKPSPWPSPRVQKYLIYQKISSDFRTKLQQLQCWANVWRCREGSSWNGKA